MARTVILVGAAVLATACGAGHATATPAPTSQAPAPVSVPPTSATAAPTPTSTPSASGSTQGAVTASGRCGTAALSAAMRMAGPAAGHRYAVFVLTNRSGHVC